MVDFSSALAANPVWIEITLRSRHRWQAAPIMSDENGAIESTGNLNIAADAASIYQQGRLVQIAIDDLLQNKTALRQFVNHYNQVVKKNEQIADEISVLKVAHGKLQLQPMVLIPAALINIIGGCLIGLGTNYLSSPSMRPVADWIILVAGVALLLIGAVGPILYSDRVSKRT